MNTFNKAVAASAVAAAHPKTSSHYQRSNAHARDVVDHAIAVQETANTMAAVEYLKSHDIAAHVIERVLLDPEHRRTSNDS